MKQFWYECYTLEAVQTVGLTPMLTMWQLVPQHRYTYCFTGVFRTNAIWNATLEIAMSVFDTIVNAIHTTFKWSVLHK